MISPTSLLKEGVSYIINLRERKDRRKRAKIACERRGLSPKLHIVDRHPTSGAKGCLESHVQVMQDALRNAPKSAKHLLIFEDDVKFLSSLTSLRPFPEDYDMLYLGGTVHRIMDGDAPTPLGWRRVTTWTTHAYVINLQKRDFVESLIAGLLSYGEEIDRYYMTQVHPTHKVYICDPMICLQESGYSDIEGREVDYSFMQQTLRGLRQAESRVSPEDGSYTLLLPEIPTEDLPMVSIVTPTKNRYDLFPMAIRNFVYFDYPKEKLEWIIVDDSNGTDSNGTDSNGTAGEEPSVKTLLPASRPNIHYVELDPEIEWTIAAKRNVGAERARGKYILHMDDDDYYPPESILARVKTLMKYEREGIECVGCNEIGNYNLLSDTSGLSNDGTLGLSEASMGYSKRFWEKRGFDGDCMRGEHKGFIEGRLHQVVTLPYIYVLIAMNHHKNFSAEYRADTGNKKSAGASSSGPMGPITNFYDMWDVDTQIFVEDLRTRVLEAMEK
jgi:hypothetical protein